MDTTKNRNAASGVTETSPAHRLERAASTWLGNLAVDKPALEAHWAEVDRLSHALLASFTSGASPPSQVQAAIDWAMHLRLAAGQARPTEQEDGR